MDISGGEIGIKLEVNLLENIESHFHSEIELIYLLEGALTVEIGKDKYNIKKEDIIVINSGKRHIIKVNSDALACRVIIKYQLLSSYLNSNLFLFWCNSVMDNNESINKLRHILQSLLKLHLVNNGKLNFAHYSKLYRLLDVLVDDFLINNKDIRFNEEKDKYSDRMQEILGYIQGNYSKQITLNELAENLYLSNSYLSRFLKQNLGMNFMEYLNNIRLHYAVEELLYSDKPITKIAMDNGFTNVTKFNKVFKDNYNTTPSAYKKEMKVNKKVLKKESSIKVMANLEKYLEDKKFDNIDINDKQDQFIIENVKHYRTYEKPWRVMINGGSADDLLKAGVQNHTLKLKEELGFKYVRFWNLFSEDMYIQSVDGRYNFDKLDEIITFLLKNDLKPYIEIGQRPQIILKGIGNELIKKNVHEVEFFNDLDQWRERIDSMMNHLLKHYTREEVSSWIFELWKPSSWDMRDDEVYCEKMYLQWFEVIYKTIKKNIQDAKVGGVEFTGTDNIEEIERILNHWNENEYKPDYISMVVYPYTLNENDVDNYIRVTSDRFLSNEIKIIRLIMDKTNFKNKDIHISEWNFTISNRNIINDSCFKGAYIINNMIDIIDKVSVLGYWIGTDKFSEYFDSYNILYGGAGLVTKNGIGKPALYAFKFLNRLKKYIVSKGENYIITTDGRNNYSMICYNLKSLGHYYYMKKEENLTVEDLDKAFVNLKSTVSKFKLEGLENGNYEIKTHSVSSKQGSILDEWKNWDCASDLKKEENSYLNNICRPKITIRQSKVNMNYLNFEVPLLANEFVLIEITHTDE